MPSGVGREVASSREEEDGLTKSSRSLVRHLKERKSDQGVMGAAKARDELSSQESLKGKNGNEGTVYEGQEG